MRSSKMRSSETTKASGQADFCDDAEVLFTAHESHDFREASTLNTVPTNRFVQPQLGDLPHSFSEVAQPENGAAMHGRDYLCGVAHMFGIDGRVSVCSYRGAGVDAPTRFEIYGRVPKAALKGLPRIRDMETEVTTLCWRQDSNSNTPLYALQGLCQLVDLLAAAGEVRP